MTTLLYRGPLASCNYGCPYCPFRHNKPSAEELGRDRRALERFVAWVKKEPRDLSIFFTPRGEALIHGYYQEALTELSRVTRKVVAQTNLSGSLAWLTRAERQRIALWCTFHPAEVDSDVFLGKCEYLRQVGIPFSVGTVGIKENLCIIRRLRDRLPASVYLWINAFKQEADYYSPAERAAFRAIDPYFPYNTKRYNSLGRACACGASVFAVDGAGDIRRCHFTDKVLANLYENSIPVTESARCPTESCWCHIGYVHLEELGLRDVFAGGVLERIPASWGER